MQFVGPETCPTLVLDRGYRGLAELERRRVPADAWLAAAEAGVVRTRSGDLYKPSALRAYRASLDSRVVPELGHLKLSAVTRPVVQDLVDRLVAEGLAPSTERNTVLPLRAIIPTPPRDRRAIERIARTWAIRRIRTPKPSPSAGLFRAATRPRARLLPAQPGLLG